MYRPRSSIGGVPMEGVKFGGEVSQFDNRPALREIGNFAQGYQCAASKRILSEIGADEQNSKKVIGHRPITRRFAASVGSQSLAFHQGQIVKQAPIGSERQQRSLLSAMRSNEHSTIVIDVDNDDLPRPMIEEIEEMVTFELKEIEMEDLDQEKHADIDICDVNNPLAVFEYVEDIHNFYWQTESLSCVSPGYMSNQYDINEKMRAILIDWLVEVHYKFELMDQTLFLTVNIIDRFLSRQTVARKKLQLVGITAMLLACKYEEVSVPVVEDLILISDRAYTRKELLEMERLIVNTLEFNFSMPTAYVFMRRFLKAAEFDKKLELLSFFLIELCLVEYQMLKFQPSLLAAAAVYTAECTIKGFKNWSKTSQLHARYSENQLSECSKLMVEFHQKAGHGKLTGVLRKYSTFKFGYAAKAEPAIFLL